MISKKKKKREKIYIGGDFCILGINSGPKSITHTACRSDEHSIMGLLGVGEEMRGKRDVGLLR